MRELIKGFIKYPTWSNVIVASAMLFGLIAVLNMRTSFFAELENNTIGITVIYPGASPEEIELGVIRKIEDNLKGLRGIDRFTSISQENMASINVEVFRQEDMDAVFQDVKNAVDRISSFPAGIEPVVVAKNPSLEFVLGFGIYGSDDLGSLKKIARKVEDELRAIDGISQVNLSGFPEEEIVAYVDEESMRRYNLTFDMVSRAFASANLDLTAGSIKTETEEIIIRLESKEYFAEYLQDIVVRTGEYGEIVTLSDIAKVRNTWAEDPARNFIDGKPAVMITVNKLIGEEFLDIADKVKSYIEAFNESNDQYKAVVLADFTQSLKARINTLIENGIMGVVLIVLSLSLFLNWRVALWVSIAIPFSFLGMFLAGFMWGLTINVLSLFGCIVVVGILVDNGIVIAEQIFQYHEQGENPFRAAIKGTLEVLPSVFFGIITTVAMFMPFFFLDSNFGASLKDFAFVVIFTLVFSLIQAALILPVNLARSKALVKDKQPSRLRQKVENILMYPRNHWYKKSLDYFLSHTLIVFAIIIFITLLTAGAINGRVIGFTFFPYIDRDDFDIYIELPAGTREDVTGGILERIEKAAIEVNKEFSDKRSDGNQVIKHIVRKTAQQPGGGGPRARVSPGGNSHQGYLQVILLDGEIRDMPSFEISNAIRQKVGPLYEVEKAIFGTSSMFGKPISFTFVSSDLQELENVKNIVKDGILNIPEVADISDNDPQGLREINIKLRPEAYSLGLNDIQVAGQIRQGFFGAEVQRIQRGEDEIKVWVKYSKDYRSQFSNWEDMRIRAPNGKEYPLKQLVDYDISRGSIVINHINGEREITVDADLVDRNMDVPPLIAKIEELIINPVLAETPSVRIVESGQKRQINMMQRSAQSALAIALISMFFLIVLSFRSFLQAAVVMMLIPLGIIGAFWGHWLFGMSVNIMSAYGIIALMGIVVNGSIVFINTFNEYIKRGVKVREALLISGVNRFRPILLTTVTTVLGLFPLMLEKSTQAQFLIPMAISVSFGLMFTSFCILIFLPSLLYVLNHFKAGVYKTWHGEWPEREKLESAYQEQKMIEQYETSNGD